MSDYILQFNENSILYLDDNILEIICQWISDYNLIEILLLTHRRFNYNLFRYCYITKLILNNHNSFLNQLTNIRFLTIKDTQIFDLYSITNLIHLNYLCIIKCPIIFNLKKLSNFNNLQTIILGTEQEIDICYFPISLKTLRLNNDNIINFQQLSNLTNLRLLQLLKSNIIDLNILPKSLTWLDLNYCVNITDFSPLSDLTNLILLYLNYTNIIDLNILPKSLIMLWLCQCKQIVNFSPLSNLTNLNALSLIATNISDITCLTNLYKLEGLYLSYCEKLHDITPINELTNLKELDMLLHSRHLTEVSENILIKKFGYIIHTETFSEKFERICCIIQ